MRSDPQSLRSIRLTSILILLAIFGIFGESSYTSAALVGPVEARNIPVADNPDLASDIGPEGGGVTSADGRVRVTVPAGAFQEVTRVLVATSQQAGPPVAFEFDVSLLAKSHSPAAPQLTSAIEVTLTPTKDDLARLGVTLDTLAAGTDSHSSLSLKRLDDTSSQWTSIPAEFDATILSLVAQISELGHYAVFLDGPPGKEKQQTVLAEGQAGILIADHGKITLEFPPGVSADSLRVEYSPHRRYVGGGFNVIGQFDLNAYAIDKGDVEVTRFDQPIKLTVSPTPAELANFNLDALRLYWRNEATLAWEEVPNQTVTNGVISAELSHFSTYSYGSSSNIAGPAWNLHHQVNPHSGTASLSIPIPLPPGPGGFTPPALTLSYNSGSVDEMKTAQSMGSWTGIGWDISIPTIIRDPGGTSTSQLQERYFLVMGGVADQLIEDTQTQPGGGWEKLWRTKNEQYVRIRSNDGTGTGLGQTLFEVTTKDGTTYLFGGRDGAQSDPNLWRSYWQYINNEWHEIVYRLDLGTVQDTNGNHADYAYSRQSVLQCVGSTCKSSDRSRYVSEIQWGAWGTSPPDNVHKFRVLFDLSNTTSRTDSPTCYAPLVFETRFLYMLRLQTRDQSDQGQWKTSKRWEFAYDWAPPGECTNAGTMKLAGLREYGARDSGGTGLRYISFVYTNLGLDFNYTNPEGVIIDCFYSFGRPFLQSASNGVGGSITFTYERKWRAGAAAVPWGHCGSANPLDTQPTWSRQVVKEVRESPGVFSGASQAVLRTYSYGVGPKYWLNPASGFNDPVDADFRGFADAKVTEYRDSGATPIAVGHSKCNYYTTGSSVQDILTGLPYWCEWFDYAKGSLIKYVSTAWSFRSVATDVNFVYKQSEQTSHFWSSQLDSYFTYDSYGNLTSTTEFGSTGRRWSSFDFSPNVTAWIVGLPARELKFGYDESMQLIVKWGLEFWYDDQTSYTLPPTKGHITRTRRYIDDTTVRDSDRTTYDQYGNTKIQTKYRESQVVLQSERFYDTYYHAYVTDLPPFFVPLIMGIQPPPAA